MRFNSARKTKKLHNLQIFFFLLRPLLTSICFAGPRVSCLCTMCLLSCKGPISMANHNSLRYSNEPIRYQSYLWLAEGRENGWARATQDTIFGGWAPDWLGRDFSANRRALKGVALTGLLSTTNWRSLIFVSRHLQTINNTADVMVVRHSWPVIKGMSLVRSLCCSNSMVAKTI